MNGQASMMAIMMAVVIVIILFMFLLTNALTPKESSINTKTEFRDLFATNLLLSLLNTDVGCGTMEDLVKAEFFVDDCPGVTLEDKLDYYMDAVLLATGQTNYDWKFEVKPKNFGGSAKSWGNDEVTSELGYWNSLTFLSWMGKQLEVKLYIRNK